MRCCEVRTCKSKFIMLLHTHINAIAYVRSYHLPSFRLFKQFLNASAYTTMLEKSSKGVMSALSCLMMNIHEELRILVQNLFGMLLIARPLFSLFMFIHLPPPPLAASVITR
jgi:hypothetical protein